MRIESGENVSAYEERWVFRPKSGAIISISYAIMKKLIEEVNKCVILLQHIKAEKVEMNHKLDKILERDYFDVYKLHERLLKLEETYGNTVLRTNRRRKSK